MTRVAIVEIATGNVLNAVELVRDDDGLHPHWPTPDGCMLIDSETASAGWTWDGTNLITPVKPGPSRLDVLMSEGPATQVLNEATEAMDDRPADDIAADKAELLGLLQTKLAASGDLTWEQMNKMLALERES